MWFDESEANVREVLDKARAAVPCVLFFDELYLVVVPKGSVAGDKVFNQLLTEIDGAKAMKDLLFI